jgi:hypothetical protein
VEAIVKEYRQQRLYLEKYRQGHEEGEHYVTDEPLAGCSDDGVHGGVGAAQAHCSRLCGQTGNHGLYPGDTPHRRRLSPDAQPGSEVKEGVI